MAAESLLARAELGLFRFAYRILRVGGHRYLSTYCQHDLCHQCRDFCKTCGHVCICGCHDSGPV